MRLCNACWEQATRQTSMLRSGLSFSNVSTPYPSCTVLRQKSGASQQRQSHLASRRSRSTLNVVAAAKPQSEREGPQKTNFFTKLFRPLRDFGLGKTSLWEGGVGLFIFAGIGWSVHHCAVKCCPRKIQSSSGGFVYGVATYGTLA